MSTDMKLPELGENIEGGDVLRVMVKAGDALKKDQAVLELETDKATIEVPSSLAGVVKDVKIKPGEKVKVGQTADSFEKCVVPAVSAVVMASCVRSKRSCLRGCRCCAIDVNVGRTGYLVEKMV